jgi:isoleucyl-tRNA synthetase/8-oxo-dGTP pyrophosphatase MutT (NUDIX family)
MEEKQKLEKNTKPGLLNNLNTVKTINEKEIEVLNFWNTENIFEKSLRSSNFSLEKGEESGENRYTFYDGPPFATGMPHHGTVLQSCIKDAIPRYQTMKGKQVRRVWGWDCHGLPIENLVEKEIGLKSKQDIETFGVANFNKAAADSVYRYEREWKKIVPRLGRFVDMEKAYATINSSYTESVWWSFSELYKKGLAYEGHYIMHICPRCETPLAQSEVNQPGCYKDVTDISVYVPFEIVSDDENFKNTSLLAWTTTPWTLPGNTAIAINKSLTYVKVEIDGKFYIVGKERVEDILKLKITPIPSLSRGEQNSSELKEFSGESLIGLKYKPVFEYFNNEEFLKTLDTEKSKKENIYKVWHADFVTADTGTGIAHEAPAFGEEDYRLAEENKIPTILHVKMNGEFVKEVTDFANLKVKKKDDTQSTDIEIIKWLAHNGKLFHKQKIIHSYPHCWRCDTPLLNYATTSWYVNIQKVKAKLVEKNKDVKWIPEHVREGRFGKWLEGARDWALSRNRYWGAPIPVWKSEEGVFVPSSLKELQTRTKSKNTYTFIRHGEAYSNIEGVISVIKENDKGLTENGKKQIQEIANNLKGENKIFDLIISSPYKRTEQTAEILAEKISNANNIKPVYVDPINPPRENQKVTNRKGVIVLIKHWSEQKYLLNSNDKFGWRILITGGMEGDENPIETAKREVLEETGFKNIRKIEKINFSHIDSFYRLHKGDNALVEQSNMFVELENGEQVEVSEEEKEMHQLSWKTKEEILSEISHDNHRFVVDFYLNNNTSNFEKIFKGYKLEDVFSTKFLVDDRLQEFQLEDEWEGQKWTDLYNETKGKYFIRIHGEKESRYEMGLRIANLIYELEEKYKDEEQGKNILLVSHSSPIEAINVYNSGAVYEKTGPGPSEWKHYANGETLELNFKPLPHDETGAINFHIPFIDNVKVYDKNGNIMKREGGVFDCWYESGSMPYAQFHYPFENQELFKNNFPADFISEGVDQTRGWFYSMFVLGVALFDKSPFNSVICTGLVMAKDGRKISKSLKNYTDPMELVEKYGLDSVRYYLISSPVVKGEATSFSDDEVGDVYRKNISRLLNVLSFYKMYKIPPNPPLSKGEQNNQTVQSEHPIDQFILARLKQVRLQVSNGFDNLQLDEACKPIDKFIDDLSVWFLRRSRERLKDGDLNAIQTLEYVLFEFSKILAPITPFTAEMIYKETKKVDNVESVHLQKWTEDIDKNLSENELSILEKMNLVREVVSIALDQRTKANVKVRQPLQSITINSVKYEFLQTEKELQNEIKDELNIKEILFQGVEYSNDANVPTKVLFLNIEISEDLKLEGLFREVVRMVQDKRKEMNFVVSDKVRVIFENSMNEETKEALNKFKNDLEKDCGVVEFSFGEKFEIVI